MALHLFYDSRSCKIYDIKYKFLLILRMAGAIITTRKKSCIIYDFKREERKISYGIEELR